MFKISKRLYSCAQFVKSNSIVDVGTDHAKLPIWLIKNNIIDSAFACDIVPFSIERSINNIRKYRLEKKIKIFYSDGLTNVDENLSDTVVIAGLGGETISRIIKNCSWKFNKNKKFILQPTKSESNLRIFLLNNKFEVDSEVAINDGQHSYSTILSHFSGVSQKVDCLYPWIGKLSPCKESYNYALKNLRYLEKLFYGLKFKNNVKQQENLGNVISDLKKFLSFCR